MVKLKKTLGLFDAVSISIGAIIGAGIFVITGLGAEIAGPSLIISVILAAIVAMFTGISASRLVKEFPKVGGEYEYAYRTISPLFGFVSGWMWTLNKIVADSVIALGFATYFSLFFHIPLQLVTLSAIFLVTLINYINVRTTGTLINFLVIIKISILILFVVFGITHINSANFVPFNPYGVGSILQTSAIIFFAYVGLLRPIYLVEEIKNPNENVPKGIFYGLFISTIIYVLVTFVAIGLVGSNVLGSTNSPLASAISVVNVPYLIQLISIGALVATFSVLLSDFLGLSRTLFAMGRKGDLPKFLGQVEKSSQVPRNSIILTGILIGIPVLFFDLRSLAQVASFLILTYFALMNFSALKIKKGIFLFPFLGIITTLGLAFSLSITSILVGTLLILISIFYYRVIRTKLKR